MPPPLDCVNIAFMINSSVTKRLRVFILAAPEHVFLRRDLAHLGSARQLDRSLAVLIAEGIIARAGHGLYLRPAVTTIEATLHSLRKLLGPRARRLVTIDGIAIAMGERADQTNRQTLLDEKKLASAKRVLQLCTFDQIRLKSLANIERWKSQGTWVSAFDEWRLLMVQGTDQDIAAVMTGDDERCNRLRQSAPYVGLVDPVELGSSESRVSRRHARPRTQG